MTTSRSSARRKPTSKSRFRYHLRHRTDAEWLAALETIPTGELRILCACIVWFDFFSAREPPRPCPQLTAFRQDWDYLVLTGRQIQTEAPALAAALESIGYHPDLAKKRSETVSE